MRTQLGLFALFLCLFISKLVHASSFATTTTALTPTFNALYLGTIQPFKASALAMDGYYSNSILSFMHSHNSELSVAFSASNYDRAQVQILINSGHAVGASSIKVYGPNGNIVSIANQSYCQIQPDIGA
jgi:hypothetical protein